MNLIPHQWRYLDNWRREMERMLEPLAHEFNSPRVDLYETEGEVVAVWEIPGIEKKQDIHIDVRGNILNVSGTIRQWKEFNQDHLHRRERYIGSFSRSVALPAPVNPESIKASYRNGILEVRMTKQKPSGPSSIDIEFH